MGLPILLVGRGGRSRPGAAAALGTQLPADLAGHGSAAQKALDPGPDQGAGFVGGGAVGKCWHTAVSARLAHRTVPIQRPLSGADAAKWRCETRIQPPFRDPLAAAHAKTVTAAFDSREGCTDRTKPGPPPTVQPLQHLILLTLNRKFNPALDWRWSQFSPDIVEPPAPAWSAAPETGACGRAASPWFAMLRPQNARPEACDIMAKNRH